MDLVIFAPRWLVGENTFKQPFYHRNCMSEYLGNICNDHDAKVKGFHPGSSSLYSCMTPHGPDTKSYEGFVTSEQKTFKIAEGNYTFMFESGYLLKTTKWALHTLPVDDHSKVWEGLTEIRYESK